MKNLIKFEELALFIFALFLFLRIENNILIFLLLSLLPDISMIGYLINTKIGAIAYNFIHHKALALILIMIGLQLPNESISVIGLVLLAHSSIDRALGFGLKHTDSFKNTHLGKIG